MQRHGSVRRVCLLQGSLAVGHPLPSGRAECGVCGRMRAARLYARCEDPLVIFRELASHSLVGYFISGGVYS